MVWPVDGYKVDNDAEKYPEIWDHSPLEKEYLLKRLMMIGAERTKRYMINNWIENDEANFTGWRWIKFGVPRRLVSACNRYKDVLITGPRHSCPIMSLTMAAYGGMEVLHEYSGEDHEQGFVDQFGTFYSRDEAYILAVSNGQLLYPEDCHYERLFSEGLY